MMMSRPVKPAAQWASVIFLSIAVVSLAVRVSGVVKLDNPLYFPLALLTSVGIIGTVVISWRFKPWGTH